MFSQTIARLHRLACFVAAGLSVATLAACGHGSGGDSAPPTYTVGGMVTGLSGSGLTLGSSFGGDLAVNASGRFTFNTRIRSGESFDVFVKENPTSPTQLCQAANSTGTVYAANVTNVSVTCVNGYTAGGTVSGLVGSGLEVRIQVPTSVRGWGCCRGPHYAGGPLLLSADGPFAFDTVFPEMFSSSDFVVITQQPTSPTQRCVVHNSRINITIANQTTVSVVCTEFAYVTNAADDTLSGYVVDANDGALLPVGTPIATGNSPYAIVATQDKRHVFVGNEGSNDISAFEVDTATGALTAVAGSPFAAGTDPQALALYSNESYLYVASAGSDSVAAFTVDATTGALAPLSSASFATGRGPSSIGIDPGGPFVFVANSGGSNDISAFSIDPASGALSAVAGSPFPVGGNPHSLVFGAGGRFLYTANFDGANPSISGFSVDFASGTLTALSGSPFPLPVTHSIATDRTGAYLYVTNSDNVVGYAIDPDSGALTALPGFPVGGGTNAFSVTIDPTNQFLYVANDGSANVSGFTMDLSTGALTAMSGSPFPAGNLPEFLAAF